MDILESTSISDFPHFRLILSTGITNVVTSIFGTVTGGILTGRLRLSKSGCVKMMLISHVVAVAFQSSHFLLGCQNSRVEGIDFFRESNVSSESPCFCDDSNFLLSCGEDGVTYSSPCRAGCWNFTEDTFGGCQRGGEHANPGICDDGCSYMIPYLVMLVLMVAAGTLGIMPNYILFLRSVGDEDKAMAIGVIDFITGLLGFLPAPIIYGKVFDSACRYLAPDEGGVCSLYDVVDLRLKIIGMEVGLKGFSTALQFLLLYLCWRADVKQPNGELSMKNVSPKTEKA